MFPQTDPKNVIAFNHHLCNGKIPCGMNECAVLKAWLSEMTVVVVLWMQYAIT